MSLVKWDPWNELESLFDRHAKGGLWPRIGTQEPMAGGEWMPRVDITESEGEFTIKAELPEVNKDDVRVTLDKGVLTLSGERRQEKEEEGKKFHRVERYYGSFRRAFTLPDNVAEDQVQAAYKDGVLTIRLPKTEGRKPGAVEVAVN